MARKKKMNDITRAYIFSEALKEYYKDDQDDNLTDKTKLLVDILKSGEKGKLWVAEQIFGRPTQTVINIQQEEEADNKEEEVKNIPIVTWSEN